MSTGGDQLDPDRLETTDFPIVRRGFAPELVRTQLVVVADELRRLRRLVSELESEIAELEAEPPVDLEAQKITEAIGEEAVRVLDAARQAANERAARAEEEAAVMVTEAETTAARIRSVAESDRDRIRVEAEATAAEIVERGREQGRDMVAEAQTVRERMLQDLAHKRHIHRAEVEQLRAGRDRLLQALVDAQGTLDRSTAELLSAVPEAQAAAERAGLRITSEPELTVEQLEAEIATARLVDHPLLDGVADPRPADDASDAGAVDDPSRAAGSDGDGPGPYDVDVEPDVSVAEDDWAGDAADDEPDDVDLDVDLVEAEPDVSVAEDGGAADGPGPYDVDVEPDVSVAEDGGAGDAADDDRPDPMAAEALRTIDAAWAEDAAEVNDVDDLFARLRSTRRTSVEAVESIRAAAELTVTPSDTDDSSDTDDPSSTNGRGPLEADESACDAAIDELTRALKRVVVDEQGELLDGIRQDGADAVRSVLATRESVYLGVVMAPVRAMVEAVAGADIDVGTDRAATAVRSLLVEPVRTRLLEALDDTEDPDELSTTVRAVYRECRSRRIGEAATTAVASVYEIAVGARPSTTA